MTIYYSSHDAVGGGSGTILDPFTLQELFDTVTNNDLGLIMDTGTYSPTGTIYVNTNNGTVSSRINIRGAASDGTDDGTIATISGTGLAVSTNLLNVAVSYLRFSNLRVTSSTQHNIYIDGANYCDWINCRVDNALNDAFYQVGLNNQRLRNCEIDHNGGNGWNGSSTTRRSGNFYQCSFHHNSGNGINISAYGGELINCLVYANGSDGVNIWPYIAGRNVSIIGCTVDGNASAGIHGASSTSTVELNIHRSILSNNGTYGFHANGLSSGQLELSELCAYNNGTAPTDLVGGLPSGTITTDPAYISRTNDSEDLTPTSTGLSLNYSYQSAIGGTTYAYIGAIQPQNVTSGDNNIPKYIPRLRTVI